MSSFPTVFSGLARLSLPLIFGQLATMAMLFVDRYFLAQYSLEAMSAVTSAGTVAWAIIVAASIICGIAQVFVAQSCGSGQEDEIGRPVWQMLWMALFVTPLFAIMALFAPLLYSLESEITYFRWMMLCGPVMAATSALAAYFIGQGKTRLVFALAVLGNCINAALDPALIFGRGPFPSLGCAGAAIATATGMAAQFVVFFALFLSKKNRARHGTHKSDFDAQLFKQIARIGLPPALFCFLEMSAWGIQYSLMRHLGVEYIVTTSICQAVLLMYYAFGMGLEKGVSSLAGNAIGAQEPGRLKTILSAALVLTGIFGLFSLLTMIFFPEPILAFFPLRIEEAGLIQTAAQLALCESLLRTCLALSSLHIILETVRMVFSGLLTAAADTLFLAVAGTAGIWLFMLLPTYLFVVVPKAPVETVLYIWAGYSVFSSGILAYRFASGAWGARGKLEVL